jgi:hypothetical protein
MGFISNFFSNPIAAITDPISETIGTSGNTGQPQGVLANFIANPVQTVSNTISTVANSPAKAVSDAWSSGGRDAAAAVAAFYGIPLAAEYMGAGAATGAGAAGAAGAGGAGAGTAAAGGAAGFFGGTTLGNIGAAVGIASGINALTGGGVSKALGIGPGAAATGTQAQTAADPFAPYRGNLAAMYSGALTSGSTLDPTKMPGYSQFESGVLNPAMEASKRSGAKSGILYSGNEQRDLQGIGQQGYYGFMTDYLNRLATGSGAGYAPSEAARLGLNQSNLNQQGFMQGLGALSTGLSGLGGQFGTPAGYNVAGNAAQITAPYGYSDLGFNQYASGGYGYNNIPMQPGGGY